MPGGAAGSRKSAVSRPESGTAAGPQRWGSETSGDRHSTGAGLDP
jgi:hypothetical protein